jgi:hypothetical protein
MGAAEVADAAAAGSSNELLAEGSRVLLGETDLGPGDKQPTRDAVETQLSALLQSEHLNLLIGAGLTTGLAHAAGSKSTVDMQAPLSVGDAGIDEKLESAATEAANAAGRGEEPNIEDRLSVAMSVVRGLAHLGDERAEKIAAAVDTALGRLRGSIVGTESDILGASAHAAAGAMTVQGLIMTFLGAFAGRAPTRDRLHIFTTNYDRVIEWGAELAGLRVIDRFVGSMRPVFRSSRLEVDYHYSPPGSVRDPRHLDGVFRLTKLHGSLDWEWSAKDRAVVRQNAPFGRVSQVPPGDLLIYPNSAKDSETNFYPYADLFRDYSAALCRPHSVLVTYGYSFGDEHINRVIRDMLTIPSTHLMAISFDDKSGRIERFANDHRRLGQISLLIGSDVAGLDSLVDRWLPWPSAEFLTEKRAQIYRDRGVVNSSRAPAGNRPGAEPGGD